RYFYAGWRVVEERTGGGDVIAQTVWGTEHIDAPICRDFNTKFETTSCIDESSRRYFYHQDINFRVTALTDESGEIVERYDYDAYGNARIYSGGAVANSGEGGVLLAVSSVGNPYMHQGLRRDDETGTFENRMRCYNPRIGRFMQRDPAGYVDGMNLYQYLAGRAFSWIDPFGLCGDPQLRRHEEEVNILVTFVNDWPGNLTFEVFDSIEHVKEALDTAEDIDDRIRAELKALRDLKSRLLQDRLDLELVIAALKLHIANMIMARDNAKMTFIVLDVGELLAWFGVPIPTGKLGTAPIVIVANILYFLAKESGLTDIDSVIAQENALLGLLQIAWNDADVSIQNLVPLIDALYNKLLDAQGMHQLELANLRTLWANNSPEYVD
ncbi:MAG: hypothetical protein KDA32_13965, partial [Phycisphaerales bacterium]|nr:hypothetical protein [Phycisphaerales bacterium]